MIDRSIELCSRQALLVAALIAPLLGCEEECPDGAAPITTRVVVCDELTDTCEEQERVSCPCTAGLSCRRTDSGAASCGAPTGAGEWVAQSVPIGSGFVIDGAFTGDEWDYAQRLQGLYTDVYLDYRAGRVYFLNDWRANREGIRPDCFNYFRLTAGDDEIELRVYGNGEVQVARNGVDVSHDAEGAYGFGPSPTVSEPHTIYEFSIAVASDAVDICCFDPVNEASCDVLAHEPMVVSVRAVGGVEVRRSVPVGAVPRLAEGSRCGGGEGICEDGLSCEPVGPVRQCVVMATSPDGGIPDGGALDGGVADAGAPGFDSGPRD